jgi:diguanylate cyclase (GGDEF)-like protein
VAVGYPITDLVMVVIVVLIAAFRRPRSPGTLLLLGAGLIALSVSDSFFLYLVAIGAPAMPPVYDIGFVTGPVLLGLAALVPEPGQRRSRPTGGSRADTWFVFLPYLPLIGIGLLVVLQQVSGRTLDPIETYGLIVLVGIVVLRQLLTLLENHELLRRVQEGQDRLHHQAFHDWLTGLPNRALFRDRLEHAVERHRRGGHRLAVLFCDLDDFKGVNDTFGHPVGDELLRAVAQRLRQCVRAGDTVARLGGDEFAIVLDDDRASPHAVGDRILAALGEPLTLAGQPLFPRASAGLVVLEPGERALSAEQLLHRADAAMYEAKREGKGRLVVHRDQAAGSLPDAGGRLAGDLEAALRGPGEGAGNQKQGGGSLELVYQPIVRLSDGAVVAVEALARWRSPQTGAIPPETLVAAADEAGLGGSLQKRVLLQACRQAAQLRGSTHPDLVVHVNVSAASVTNPQLVRQVRAALEGAALPGSALVVEVTNAGRVEDRDAAAHVLESVRRLGVKVALDDVGAGHAALDHLLRLPVDILKLDRTWVADLVAAESTATPDSGALQTAHQLEIALVAEGVEAEQHVTRLTALGCEYGQGYLFARPMSYGEASRLIFADRVPV